MPELFIAIAIGYLLGSIPFAYLVARAWGVDIFGVGTRNPGAANVYRMVGAIPGSLVFLLDVAKSAGAVVIASFILSDSEGSSVFAHAEWRVLPGLAAILGHWFPVFLRFRGGAGLASAIGASLALLPVAGGVAIAVGLLFQWKFKSSGHSALAGLAVYLGVGIGTGHWAIALAASSTFVAVFGYYLLANRVLGRRP